MNSGLTFEKFQKASELIKNKSQHQDKSLICTRCGLVFPCITLADYYRWEEHMKIWMTGQKNACKLRLVGE